MQTKILIQLALSTALIGCAHPTDPFRHAFKEPVARIGDFFPPSTIVRVKTAAPDQVTYEYARMTGNGLPNAIDAAQQGCTPAGKRAHIVSLGMRNVERGYVTFACL